MKGIFCIEGEFERPKNLARGNYGANPLLEMLRDVYEVPFIYRRVATRGEFDERLKCWCDKAFDSYPILYLSFHGHRGGELELYDRRKKGAVVTFDQLGVDLAAGLTAKSHGHKRRVVVVSACNYFEDTPDNVRSKLLSQTGLTAIYGYEKDIEFVATWALELIVLAELGCVGQLTPAGLRAVHRSSEFKSAKSLRKALGFRWSVRE